MENLELNNNEIEIGDNNIENEKKYWDSIQDIKWYFLSRNYGIDASKKVTEFLIKNFTLDEVFDFKNFVVDKRKYLENRISSYLRILTKDQRKEYKLSDDGTWDLCSHIVGMGETVYYYVLHHIDSIFLFQKDIQENFEYGFDGAIYEINNKIIDNQN